MFDTWWNALNLELQIFYAIGIISLLFLMVQVFFSLFAGMDDLHDISDGGMLVAVAEMALAGGMGAEVSLELADPTETSLAAAHFGEDQGRFLVTTAEPIALRELANEAGVKATLIGTTGFFSQVDQCEGILCESSDAFASLADLRAAHEGFFPALMQGEL